MLAAPRTKTRSNSLFHVAALLPRAVASCVREFPFNLLIGMLLGRRLCPAQLVSPAGNLAKRGFASMSAARNSGYNCATISLSAGRATTWRLTELLADVPERSLAEVGGGVTRPMGARPSGEEKGETRLSASSRLEPSICWSCPRLVPCRYPSIASSRGWKLSSPVMLATTTASCRPRSMTSSYAASTGKRIEEAEFIAIAARKPCLLTVRMIGRTTGKQAAKAPSKDR